MLVSKLFPDGTAQVVSHLLDLPRGLLQPLEQVIAEATGIHAMNHTIYEVVGHDDQPIYLWFTDMSVTIGTTLVREHPSRSEKQEGITTFHPPLPVMDTWTAPIPVRDLPDCTGCRSGLPKDSITTHQQGTKQHH